AGSALIAASRLTPRAASSWLRSWYAAASASDTKPPRANRGVGRISRVVARVKHSTRLFRLACRNCGVRSPDRLKAELRTGAAASLKAERARGLSLAC